MATKKATKRTVRKAAAKKTPARKKPGPKPGFKRAAKAVKKTTRKTPAKKVSPLKGRKYGPRKPKIVEMPQTPEQLEAAMQRDKTDAEVAAAQSGPNGDSGPSFGEFVSKILGGCEPCENGEESELEEIDILDLRGINLQNRFGLLCALGGEGYITTIMGDLTAIDVLPKLLTVDYLALNHNNKLVREASEVEVNGSVAVSTPSIRLDVEVAFSKVKGLHPFVREIDGATYLRVS